MQRNESVRSIHNSIHVHSVHQRTSCSHLIQWIMNEWIYEQQTQRCRNPKKRSLENIANGRNGFHDYFFWELTGLSGSHIIFTIHAIVWLCHRSTYLVRKYKKTLPFVIQFMKLVVFGITRKILPIVFKEVRYCDLYVKSSSLSKWHFVDRYQTRQVSWVGSQLGMLFCTFEQKVRFWTCARAT